MKSLLRPYIKSSFVFAMALALLVSLAPSAHAKKDKEKDKPSPSAAPEASPNSDMGSPQFAVKPPLVDVSAQPGEQLTLTITIENRAKVSGSFALTPIGYTQTAEGLKAEAPLGLPIEDVSRNVIISEKKITIPAGSYKDITYQIKVSPNAIGSNYFGIIVEKASAVNDLEAVPDTSRKEEVTQNVGVGINAGLSILHKILVLKDNKYSYAIKSVQVTPSEGNRPPLFTAMISNTGNSELQINPILVLFDPKTNQVVTRLKTYRMVSVTPNATEKIEFQQPYKSIAPGTYKGIFSILETKYGLPPTESSVTVK